jgi:hypothetical protein
MKRVIVCSQTSKYICFAVVNTGIIFDQTVVVLLFDGGSTFAVLQSRVHEVWALFFGASLEDRPRYIPTDCYETFPFPELKERTVLEAISMEYNDFRAALMVKNDEGMTKTYNRFHSPEERSPDILKLRELHSRMDRAVLDAYGWRDIEPVYDFREQLDESIRLTWAEDTRDEVLARLLELNRVVAKKEAEAMPKPQPKATKRGAKKKGQADDATGKLFPEDEG